MAGPAEWADCQVKVKVTSRQVRSLPRRQPQAEVYNSAPGRVQGRGHGDSGLDLAGATEIDIRL